MQMRTRMTLAALPVLLLVGCGNEEQMKRVEQEVGDLKLEVFKMRQQVEELNRRSEADRAALSEGHTQDRRFQADIQDTMRQLQDATRVLANRLNAGGSARPATGPATSTPVPAVTASEEQTFNAVMLDYNKGNYALAVESLEQYVAANPKSAKRADAFYYLGYSHFHLKAYDKSLRAFDRLIKDFPGSELFLSSKYKRAICQLRLGLKAAGTASLQEIVKNFPDTPEARNAQQELTDLQ